jgi:hypothetical protein
MKKKILMLALALPILASAQTSENVQPKENSKRMGIVEFFKKAFADMREDAKAQHEVDKANFNAVKAESKAQWEEAKRTPEEQHQARLQSLEEQKAAAKAREEAAKARQ